MFFLRPGVKQPASLCKHHLYQRGIIIYPSHNINTFIRCRIKKQIARGFNLFYVGSGDSGCHRISPLGKRHVSPVSHPRSPAVASTQSNYRKACIFISVVGVLFVFLPPWCLAFCLVLLLASFYNIQSGDLS